MSDFFEERQRDNIFQPKLPESPEGYKPDASVSKFQLPETPEEYANQPKRDHATAMQSWNEDARQRQEYREQTGGRLSPQEYNMLYDWRKDGLVDDEEIYKIVSSKELGEYLGLPPAFVYEMYDDLWREISEERGTKFALTKNSYKAIGDSVQIAKNMMPIGKMGVELQSLHNQINAASGTDKDALQQRADKLWEEITALQKANEGLSRGMPKDALTTIITSTIQSAPLTGKSVIGGVAGGLTAGTIGAVTGAAAGGVGAAPGFLSGWNIGYNLGSFLASSSEMVGLMYVDLLAAGVEQKNASRLAMIGGSLQGFIEVGLGTVAGWGKSAAKVIGGKTLSKAAQVKIAETASKNFIKKMSSSGLAVSIGKNAALKTVLETAKQAGEEGLEEGLQTLVDQAMLSLGDALQDAPVERNSWGSPEFMSELRQSIIGGIAGGFGFGIVGLPLNVAGNISETARQTNYLKKLAVTIDNEAEFRAAAKETPLVKNLSDEQINQIYNSQEGERQAYRSEEARTAEELKDVKGLGVGYAEQKYNKEGEPIPLGDTYRRKNGRLYTQLDEKRGLFKIGDGSKDGTKNLYAHIGYELGDDGTVRIKEFKVRPDLDKAEFRREIWGDFTERFAGHKPVWEAETTRQAEIIDDLEKNNPYGNGLNYYPEALNENIADEVVDTAAKGDTAESARMKLRFGEQMARHLPGSTEASRSGAVRLIDRIGRAYGYTFDQFIKKLRLDPENIFTHTQGEAVEAENAKAAQFAKEGENPQKVRGALQPWKRLDADIKAVQHSIIYLDPEGAGLSTVLHELKHAVDNFLEKNDPKLFKRMMDAAGEYDPKNSGGMDENRWRLERSAYAFETYLQTGQAPTAELRSLFQQMKEWLKEIVEYVNKGLRKLSPKQKEAFDELLSKADEVSARRDALEAARMTPEQKEFFDKQMSRAAQEGRVTAQAANDTAAGAEGAQKASTAQYEANKKLHEERISQSKNNAEGDAKPEQTGVNSIQELREKAEKDIPKVDSWAEKFIADIKEKYGIELEVLWRPTDEDNPLPIKTVKSIQDKLDKGDKITQVLDVLGITLVAKNYADLVKVTEELHKRGDVVRIKDRYKELDASGYRDILTNVRLPDGMIAEVQVNVPQMLEAKKIGHKIYAISRSFPDAVKRKLLTEEQAVNDKDILRAISKELYDAANQAVLRESQFNASSRDIDWLSNVSEPSNSDLTSDLSSFTLNKFQDLGLSANSSLQYTFPSLIKNLNSGSSKDGTFATEAGDVSLSTVAAEAGTTESSNISVPSTNSIANKKDSVNSNLKNISEKNSPENEKRIERSKARWDAADRTVGAEDQYTMPNGEVLQGHWELGEAGISTPSHDPDANFAQHKDFVVNENGTTMNQGRNYKEGFAYEYAFRLGADFDQRGLWIIVDKNGQDLSGNNRDISRRIAAKDGADKKYISYLKSRPERWGFTQADIAKYEHPTVYFVVNAPSAYSPLYFDQFNRSGKKDVSPIETAIKMSYLLNGENRAMVSEFSEAMGNYDSISELYEDTQAATEIFKSLMKRGIVTENSYPGYVETMTIKGKQHERVTSNGKEFLESVMLGAVLEEASIRLLSIAPEIRKRVVKGLAALVDNAALGEYCVVSEINQAIAVAVEVQTNKKKYKSIADYADQTEMELGQRISTDIEVELAGRLLEKTEYAFSDMMGGLNAVLQEEARGQSDMFGGTSKDDILRRYLGVKARADSIREANNKVIESETAAGLERVQAAMDNAGLARSEADGTLYQTAYHGSPHRFDRFDISHIGEGEGAQAYGYGHYFASKKEVAEWYYKGSIKLDFDGHSFGLNYGESHWVSWIGLPDYPEPYSAYERNSPEGIALDAVDLSLVGINPLEYLKSELAKAEQEGDNEAIENHKAAIALIEEGRVIVKSGQLYEVDIPGDDEMLDWDKSLDEQPEKVKNALGNIIYLLNEERGPGSKNPDLQFYGSSIYGYIIEARGGDKAASQYLNSIGIKGIRYLDGSSRSKGEGTHNYVIFDDNDINITQTFFQLDDELIEEAAQYDNWRGFRNSIDEEASDADNAWYRSLWNDAKKIHKDTLFQDEEKTSRAGELDKRFYKEADKKYLTEALKELYRIHNDQSLEPAKDEDGAARDEYRRVKRLQQRINTELPNSGSIIGMAAQVRSGRALSSTQYDRLKSWIRKNTRDYRAVLADIMGQEEYLEDLADTKDGEPAGRLANPHPDRLDIKTRLKEIAKIMRETDPALAKEIEDGTVSYDDPRIAAFEQGVETEYAEAKTALDALEKETSEDYARLANDAQRRIVAAYEKMLSAREQMDSTDEKLRRMMDEEGKIAEPYLKKQKLEQANYDQALKAYNDLIDLHGRDAEVREAVARREARASERVRQTVIRRRQRALRELKEIKKRLVRRVTRKVSFDAVAYEQAEMLKAVQRISEAFIFEGINKWIGPQGREILRGVWSAWSTDEEFRETVIKEVQKRKKDGFEAADRIKNILDKDWKKITVNEKKTLHRLLPKTDFVNDLKLKELARENRESIQLDIVEKSIDNKVRMIIGEDLERRLKETLGGELFSRILNKPLSEWSIAEAEELARIVDRLTVEGRRDLAARKEARRVLEQEYRDKVLVALEKTGIDINDDDTPEEKERKEEEKNRILKKFAAGKRNNILNNFFDANLRRFTTAMDGGRKGIFTSLLYWEENNAYNKEQRQIAARRIVVDTVMKENHITLDELYREVKIPELEATSLFADCEQKYEKVARKLELPETTWNLDAFFKNSPKPDLKEADLYEVSGGKVTVDDLLYIMRGVKNKETRDAIIYGNLSNAHERGHYGNPATKLDETAEAEYENIGYYRLIRILAFANDFFAKEENKKFLKLYEAIGADYDSNGGRLNKAMIDMFNKPMWRVENYVPMNRREQTGAENENRVLEDLMGITGKGMKWVNKGFAEKRIKISPSAQKPIELGLYKTWVQSVNSTEHLLAYGPMVQTLNSVFKGYHAGELRQALKKRWGKAADDRIANTIAEFANPNPHRQRHALDDIVRTFRGKTATAYLAWKTSGILKQLMTSPWPYLQEINPKDYIAACIEVAAGAGKINDFIREKSIYMKNRDFDPMVKLIREAIEKRDKPVPSKIDKFNAVGMKGLEWIDWVCVAPGWLAVYRKELANVAEEQDAEYQKLLKKYQGSEYADVLPTMESKANRALSETMNEARQDAEAVARADDAVRRMQPSSRAADLAPLFKGQTEVFNVFLQFQTALNVIWQNIRYDLPLAVKEKQTLTVVGMVTGYMMAGICLGMLSEIGNGDDDDEEGKLARRILFYSFTQFTDAVPVIGENVTAGVEALVTGKTRYSGQQNLPVIEKAFRGAEKIIAAVREEDPEKKRKRYLSAAQDMGEAAGIAFGLPVSGAKELGRAAGIGDGDGELELYWQALLGQRKK